MKRVIGLVVAFLFTTLPALAAEDLPKPIVTGLSKPRAISLGADGRLYVTDYGDASEQGGSVLVITNGKANPVLTGLNQPQGVAGVPGFQAGQFVAELQSISRLDGRGGSMLLVGKSAFPLATVLHCVTADPENGNLYVGGSKVTSSSGDAKIYCITPKGNVSAVGKTVDAATSVIMDGTSHVIYTAGDSVFRMKLLNGEVDKLADGLGKAAGLAWDRHGRLYVGDAEKGRVFVIPRPGEKPVIFTEGFKQVVSLALDQQGKNILVLDAKEGTITALPARVPGADVDTSPLSVGTAVAFPDIKWAGWKGETTGGRALPFRPILLTHAGDGSNRNFVVTEQGVIHVFPNEQKVKESKVFLDLQDRVSYSDQQNEEGFLGMAFHPKYKENGEFFVFYTLKTPKLTNVVSRFRVSKDNPDVADPKSEEELMRFPKPFWNHDGGTICFGPDGYLYITHGDGGLGNDPHDNAQNLNSWLGKILRIDVDQKDAGKNYAIPKDNPFVGKGKPEIYAYGLRNVWRMSFDRKTGQLWAADVGQNLYEEIDLIKAGGNYGWNRREGLHPFGARGREPSKDFIEPIWEYHHDEGKSITGGTVYRGERIPDLQGLYLYADYVTGQVSALKYEEAKGRVTANRRIRERGFPVFSFGEDEKGEVYFLTETITGKGIHWFVKKD
jgi:glucose/arabinose dehydrogenase